MLGMTAYAEWPSYRRSGENLSLGYRHARNKDNASHFPFICPWRLPPMSAIDVVKVYPEL